LRRIRNVSAINTSPVGVETRPQTVTVRTHGGGKEKYRVEAIIELKELFIKDYSPMTVNAVKKIGS
jgi:hypothetical protein